MSPPDAFEGDLTTPATDLLRQAGLGGRDFKLVPLSGGANNQVYQVDFQNQAPVVLKRYFSSPRDQRDRFCAEKSFYDFIEGSGLRDHTPRALAWDREHRLGLFSLIEGRRLEPNEVIQVHVEQALQFYFALNNRIKLADTSEIPNASEACFDIEQHVACIESRLTRLRGIETDSKTGREASEFVFHDLENAFRSYRKPLADMTSQKMKPLEGNERCLSPSDFGFHNALLQRDDTVAFFDFEYAGWDDPAKFLCDFLCQPAVPIPESLAAGCLDLVCRPIPGGSERKRVTLLLPLYRLKWCCILLNEFIPGERQRRIFSQKHTSEQMESRKREQLAKARKMLEKSRSGALV